MQESGYRIQEAGEKLKILYYGRPESVKINLMPLTKSQILDLYHILRLTRTVEDWIYYICHNQNPKSPLIIGKGYLSTGQEAVSIGATYTLKKEDWVAQSHRDFGALLIRGLSVDDLLLQYFSKAASPTWGRDSNVHLGHTEKHILGFISHMGAMIPVANGVAWAAKYRKEKTVVLAFFGDGASSQGVVHEAMNYAAVFKLAVVFICNNNRWAISTPVKEQFLIENLASRGAAYGMQGHVCDGNNVVEVYETVKKAVDRARAGEGPSLVECKTMRMTGHGTHDMAKYVPDEEMEYWKARDPIARFEKYLKGKKIADDAYFKKIASECKKEVEEATERVRNAANPIPENELKDVYAP
ncbi:MAG: thiamine pyrophosphate-dependent dehydrogenase E1 component subunit alpha [Deltaproteobacteria bacterium]|nr:thiamine pyrophosphate-dependent dehydrogenase E1 component subunit alpha [Deltaproteobacteria bacterium]